MSQVDSVSPAQEVRDQRAPEARFRPDIEGLRAVAVVAVVLSHPLGLDIATSVRRGNGSASAVARRPNRLLARDVACWRGRRIGCERG